MLLLTLGRTECQGRKKRLGERKSTLIGRVSSLLERSQRDLGEPPRDLEESQRDLEELKRDLTELKRRLDEAQDRLNVAELEAHDRVLRKVGEHPQQPEVDAVRIKSETKEPKATKPVPRSGLGWWWCDPSGNEIEITL